MKKKILYIFFVSFYPAGMRSILLVICAMTTVSALHEEEFPRLLPGAIVDKNGPVAMISEYVSVSINMTSVTALPEDLKKIGNNILILEQDLRLVENELNKPGLKNTQDKLTVKHNVLLINQLRKTLKTCMNKIALVYSWFPSKD